MGNRRFRLSDMMPNAWFYKLNSKHQNHHKITSNPANTKPHAAAPPSSSSHSSLSSVKPSSPHNHQSPELTRTTHLSEQRKSYYFTRHLADSAAETPRTSSRRRRSTRRQGRSHEPQAQPLSSAASPGCICRATIESFFTKPSIPTETDDVRTSSDDGDRALTPGDAFEDIIPSCSCTADEIDGKPIRTERSSDFDQPNLPPIITKKQQRAAAPVRRYSGNASSSSPGVKLRTNTPKIGYRRGRRRRSSESFAVVKSSRDPGRDFKESMLEMIVENNIRGRADLEELLACYLSLNADEYHGLIIAVFKQIWFDLVAAGRSHNVL